jgi:hypothetical protein
MGKNLFSALILSVVIVAAIDWFVGWYTAFLTRRVLSAGLGRRIKQIFWVLLAFVFWNSLYRLALPESFDLSYVLFALFIFSLRGLVISFFVPKEKPEADG